MRKIFAITLAATLVTGQIASANGLAKGRGKDAETSNKAAKAVKEELNRAAAEGQRVVRRSGAEIVGLMPTTTSRLSSEEVKNLGLNIERSEQIRDAVLDIAKLEKSGESLNADLAEAALTAMANLRNPVNRIEKTEADAVSKMTDQVSDVTAEQAAQILSTVVATSARSWDGARRENLIFLLRAFSEQVERGQTPAEAMKLATAELAKTKGIKLDLRNINKRCL